MDNELEVQKTIDSLCNQFEEHWVPDIPPNFEDCLNRIQQSHRSQLLHALLQVDLELRIKAGQQIQVDDYNQLGEEAVAFVNQILQEQDNAETFDATRDQATLPSASPSKQIGPYKLLQQIGEGGMGTVWMAEQEKPVKRRVALKVIKAGVGSKEVITRFEAERQALSLMNHSNIARILDVGTTEDGQPYFAMELVHGKPLTTYCDDNRVGISERLQLFAEVCSGVQHAHQKGIIHRDLKPSNILVAVVDGKPVPKVIDFGLAKALESTQRLTDQSLFTGIGQILGTLKYMSPEQASLDLVDIDTRTDIYSLGVILYELLTGSTPLDNETVRGEAMLKVLQIIRDKEPAKPSSRLSTDKATLSSITNSRRTDSSSLNRILVGDLDWVVVKALEKDRNRRYESASGLAADIQRFLNNEPVTARPPSLWYKSRKLIRKHRVAFSASLVVAAAIVTGALALAYGMNSAQKSAIRAKAAEQDARSTVNDYFVLVSQNQLLEEPGFQDLRKNLLKRALDYYLRFLDKSPEIDDSESDVATAYFNLAKIQFELGDKDAAFRNVDSAINLQQNNAANSSSLQLASAFLEKGSWLKQDNRLAEAEPELLRAIGIFEHSRNTGSESATVLEKLAFSILNLSSVYERINEGTKSQQEIARAIELLDDAPAEIRADPSVQLQLANALQLRAKSENAKESVESLNRSVGIIQDLHNSSSGDPTYQRSLVAVLIQLAERYRELRQPEKSVEHFSKAIEIARVIQVRNPQVPGDLYRLAVANDQIAFSYTQLNVPDFEKAEQSYRQALAHFESLITDKGNPFWGESLFMTANIHNGLAMIYRDLGDAEKCLASFESAEITIRKLISSRPEEVRFQMLLGGTLFNRGRAALGFERFDVARDNLVKAIDQLSIITKDPTNLRAKQLLGDSCMHLGLVLSDGFSDHDEAARHFEKSLESLDSLAQQDPMSPQFKWRVYGVQYCIRDNEVCLLVANSRMDEAIIKLHKIKEWIANEISPEFVDPEYYWNLAVLAAKVNAALGDGQSDSTLAAFSVECLNAAKDLGIFDSKPNVEQRLVSTEFDSIRDSAEFRELVAEIGKE